MTSINATALFVMFGITVLPYFFYGKPDIRNHKITHAIRRYANIVVPVSLFYLFLFSIYKSRGMVAALGYLAESFNLKYMTVVSLLNGIIIFTDSKLKKKNITVSFFTKNVPRYLIATILVFWFLVFASLEFTEMYAIIPIEQFMFHLAYPVTNGNFSMVRQMVIEPMVNSFCITLLCAYLLSVKINMKGNYFFLPFQRFKKVTTGIAAVFPFLGIIYLALAIGLPHYLFAPKEEPSRFYEENYISPLTLNVSFPEKKRNLIVIIVESLETGFLKIEEGGAFSEDLIPEITALAKNNINFSQNNGIGGAAQLYGTEWTIAGITAYYSGIPLAVSFLNRSEWNSYGVLGRDFMPEATGIGDILVEAGYQNYFILGSEIEFGGRDKYFKTHKDTAIFDYHYFSENNSIPPDYRVWWGIEDRKLYRFAKDIIGDIAKEEPFLVTLLTADTHPTGGYLDEEAERVFDSQYKNVLRDASRQLSEFIEWLQMQDFYENTTVVVLGDHLYQDSSLFPEQFKTQKLASKYEAEVFTEDRVSIYNRYPLNIFINSLLNPEKTKQRHFSHFDMLPVLVESIGGVYEGDGIALGRSLNGKDTVTLVEKYGEVSVGKQLRHKSNFYNALWGLEY